MYDKVIGAYMKSRQQKWQEKRKKDGECIRCGRRRDGTNKCFCTECAIKARENQRLQKKSGRRNNNAKSYVESSANN